MLDGDPEEEVEHEVGGDDGGAEGAHDPVEDAHVHLHQLPLHEARVLQVHLAGRRVSGSRLKLNGVIFVDANTQGAEYI